MTLNYTKLCGVVARQDVLDGRLLRIEERLNVNPGPQIELKVMDSEDDYARLREQLKDVDFRKKLVSVAGNSRLYLLLL